MGERGEGVPPVPLIKDVNTAVAIHAADGVRLID